MFGDVKWCNAMVKLILHSVLGNLMVLLTNDILLRSPITGTFLMMSDTCM